METRCGGRWNCYWLVHDDVSALPLSLALDLYPASCSSYFDFFFSSSFFFFPFLYPSLFLLSIYFYLLFYFLLSISCSLSLSDLSFSLLFFLLLVLSSFLSLFISVTVFFSFFLAIVHFLHSFHLSILSLSFSPASQLSAYMSSQITVELDYCQLAEWYRISRAKITKGKKTAQEMF